MAVVPMTRSTGPQQSQRAPDRRKPRGARYVLSWVGFAVAVVVAVIWLFPFILVVLTAIQRVGLLSGDIRRGSATSRW